MGTSSLTAYPGTSLFDMAIMNNLLTADQLQKCALMHSSGQGQINNSLDERGLLARRKGIYRSSFLPPFGASWQREFFRLLLDNLYFFDCQRSF